MLLNTMYNTVIENIDTYEKMITILVPLAGCIVAIIKWLSSIYTTAMSSPVEVTLMTKKEQYKYKNSNQMMTWIVFSALFIYVGVFSLLYSFEQGKNVEVVAIEDEQRVNEIEREETVANSGTIERVEDADVIYVLIYVVGFYGIFAVCVIVMILFILWFIKSLFLSIKNIQKYLNIRTVFWGVSGVITIVSCILFLYTTNIWFFIIGCIVLALFIGYIVCRGYTCMKDVLEVLKVVSVVSILAFLTAINNIYIWTADNYNTVLSILIMALGSIALSTILCMLMSLIAKLNINREKAKVKYFNKKIGRDLYLYFRFNDEFFIAGEKERMEDCETYYLIKVDEVVGERLEKVKTQSANYSTVYSIANRKSTRCSIE